MIKSSTAPSFEIPGLRVTGLAAPSRGSRETSVWRIAIAPGTPGTLHSVDREEIFVALTGTAIARVGDDELELAAGDTLVVPAGQPFSLATGDDGFEALCVLPAGGRARMPGGEPFVPPWAA